MSLTASIEFITGSDKRENKENDKKKHLKLQGTHKIGVHANIQIHTYTIIFPEF